MLDQLERQEIIEEQRPEPQLVTTPAYPAENDQRQRRRMVIALILLLVALGLVLVKDRDFWFPAAPEAADSDTSDDSAPPVATETTLPAAVAPKPSVGTPKRQKDHAAPAKAVETPVAAAPSISVARAVLPPLRVEVVAGDRHQAVKTASPSVRVDLQSGAEPTAPTPAPAIEAASAGNAPVTNAGERVQISADSRQALAARPVRPEYPLLARQMKVQGAVVLEAWVGRDGGIQNLHVVDGPSILADAAQQAVKQWRFKPYYQDGQPVETQIPITVNFTISTK